MTNRGFAALPVGGHRKTALWQGVCAAILALAVMAGGLEFHPAAESHDLLASFAHHDGDFYYQGASHPVQPPHAETARRAQRPVCALCLNRLQNIGSRSVPTAVTGALVAAGGLPIASALAPIQRALRPDGARAPPVA